jgi:choice-of-anchor A domain-containing protein
MSSKSVRALILAVMPMLAIPVAAQADSLSQAFGYNLFILNDLNQSGTDTQGKVAVGRNATISSFSVASQLPADSATNFVVGGSVSQTGGTVNGSAISGAGYSFSSASISGNLYTAGDIIQNQGSVGNVVAGGNYTVSQAGPQSALVGGTFTQTSGYIPGNVTVGGDAILNNPSAGGYYHVNGSVTITGGGSAGGGITYGTTYSGYSYFNPVQVAPVPVDTSAYTTLPINFTTVAADLNAASTYWGSLVANGSTAISFSQLTLTGTDANLNIFDLTAAQLSSISTLAFSVPAGSTALINVDGATVNLGPFGYGTITGLDAEHILYNAFDAGTVNMSGIGLEGSLLAPGASVNFASGDIDGSIIANNLSGQGESHLHLFDGSLPTPPPTATPFTAVPTPTSVVGGVMLLSLVVLRRTRYV